MHQSVKIKDSGTSGRILEVEIGRKQFTTPTRVANHVENGLVDDYFVKYSPKGIIGEIPPCEVQETVLDFNELRVHKLCEKNGELHSERRFLRGHNRNRDSRLKICNIRLSKNTTWNEDAIKLLTVMQIKADCLDLISIPDPIYNGRSSLNLLSSYKIARETLDNHGLDNVRILPNLDLATEPSDLEPKLKEIMKFTD